MMNVDDITTRLSFTDLSPLINVVGVATRPNYFLEAYDSTWIYWRIVVDFFDQLAGDIY